MLGNGSIHTSQVLLFEVDSIQATVVILKTPKFYGHPSNFNFGTTFTITTTLQFVVFFNDRLSRSNDRSIALNINAQNKTDRTIYLLSVL